MSTNPKRLGKYQLLQAPLGRGGMGEVWKALDTQLQRYVAIKLLHTDLQNDSSFTARFQREAQLVASLHHSNIVQIYDFEVSQPSEAENAMCYMVMNYVEGPTLAQYIRATSRVGKYPSAAEIVQLFASLSLAVDYAHHKSMIHRDIKPSNILLDWSNATRNLMGEPILTDFGIAKLLGAPNNTLIGSWLGTPNYTSPEQARGDVANEQSDIYSLGVILYEICTGRLPFQGENAAVVIMQHINATPTLPHSINPNVPFALSMVIMRCLAKSPSARYPTASALTVALAEALNRPVPEELRATMVSVHASSEPHYQGPVQPTPALEMSPIAPSLQSASPVQGIEHSPRPRHTLLVDSSRNPLPASVSTTPIQGITHYVSLQGYVRGESLQERFHRLNQPMEEREVLIYASQVLDILDDLQQHGPPLVYRDIQPATIIIGTKDKQAHLVDVGSLAVDAGSIQPKQTPALGTPGYTPAEQLQGYVDPRSDLYALAATMHHLLTNRDPRYHPPFVYPPVRLLNQRLSPHVEGVLLRGLTNEITQRYQSAAEMKSDIDAILQWHSGLSSGMNDAARLSGPSAAAGAASSATASPVPQVLSRIHACLGFSGTSDENTSKKQPVHAHQAVRESAPIPPAPAGPQQQKASRGRAFLFLMVVMVLLVPALSYPFFSFHTPHATTTTLPASGIGVTLVGKAPNQEPIGVSNGTFAFDTQRPAGILKREAADKLKTGDINGAVALWRQAMALDTNDAETLIYLEDQRVLASGSPYITIVVGTILTGTNANVGRSNLQGAYVAQKESNDSSTLPNGVLVRLLIANSGSQARYASTVAKQIVQASLTDKTIVGVTGWPLSDPTLNVIKVLNVAHIPLVAFAAGDALTGISPYFFRVSAPTLRQAAVGAQYAERTLHAKRAAVFVDSTNSFSSGLAKDFMMQFQSDGNTIAATEHYTVGKPATVVIPLKDALHATPAPDMIYFAGYASDASTLLANLPTAGPLANLPVVGANALYELGGYQSSAAAALFHLHMTALAYPDEWEALAPTAQKPSFFTDYPTDFDPNRLHQGSPYGYTRASADVMLSYDALLSILQASTLALTTGQPGITPHDLRQALTKISGQQAIQGVSGQISFGADGNPLNKAILVLCVDREDRFHLAEANGQFLLGGVGERQSNLTGSCK